MSKKKSRKNLFYLMVLGLLAIVGILFLLEKTNVTNFYKSESKTTAVGDHGNVNVVDYNPATTTDNKDINARKEAGTVDQAPSIPTDDTTIQITFIANAQDTSGGQLEIRTILSGVTDGVCALTLTKNSTIIKKQSDVMQQNTYFQCEAFIIPYSELENGDWQIKLKVTSGDGRTNEATTTTTIH